VLITGSTAGIGEAYARYLASQAANITLVGRSKEKLQELNAQLPSKSLRDLKVSDLQEASN